MSARMVIALTGTDNGPAKLRRLKEKLNRRGFQVQVVQSAAEEFSATADIVLFSCKDGSADFLADQIERSWTQQWQGWFASNRIKPASGSGGSLGRSRNGSARKNEGRGRRTA